MFTSLPEPRSTACTNACTTSSMNTKSRVWFPSPKIVTGSFAIMRFAKMATTPASPCGSWRGPYTFASASAV